MYVGTLFCIGVSQPVLATLKDQAAKTTTSRKNKWLWQLTTSIIFVVQTHKYIL